MQELLLIKTSSLGDVIHTLPALTDALQAYPELRVTWVVEEPFKEVASWHPAVVKVVPMAWRRWRKDKLKLLFNPEIRLFLEELRSQPYDMVLDAQGLIKSAIVAKLAKSEMIAGFARSRAREPWAALAYNKACDQVPGLGEAHAIERLRALFAQALDYPLPQTPANAQLSLPKSSNLLPKEPYVVLLHGTTWPTKHWPEPYWEQLADIIVQQGLKVILPWGNAAEHERAQKIAKQNVNIMIFPKATLTQLAILLQHAQGIVTVDSGLGHLAAALQKPTVALYGPTDPKRTGAYGLEQKHLTSALPCSPCLQDTCRLLPDMTHINFPPCLFELTPEIVWQQLAKNITSCS